MRKIAANWLQNLYENNRVPETWGTPSISTQTFDQLREHGFLAALRYLFMRLRQLGDTKHSPMTKFFALVAGVILVTIVNAFLRLFGEKPPKVTQHEKRTFSLRVPKGLIALYAFGAGLLVLAQDGDPGPRPYPMRENEVEMYSNSEGHHDHRQGDFYNEGNEDDDWSTYPGSEN